MDSTLPLVEITVKPEPIEFEENEQIDSQESEEVKEEELWIKTEPLEDDSQDSIKGEDQGTLSENEARLDEEALNDGLSRNRQSNAPSRKQIMVFLDFLNEHRELANCMLRGPTGKVKAHRLWEDIAEKLNNIGGCHKTTQQWQRVWSDKKYLTRKAAAVRNASLSGGLPAPDLTPQDEKILAIIGEPIPPRRVSQKLETPEPKQPQEVPTLPPKRGPKPERAPSPQPPIPVEGFIPEPLPPSRPVRKPYTPRKTESSRKEVARRSDVPNSEVQSIPIIPPNVISQPVLKPPDEPAKVVIQIDDDPSPSYHPVTDLPSPVPPAEINPEARIKRRASLDPYTRKLIHLEEERLKNDAKRNSELSEIRLSLQQGTAELTEIRKVMQEMVGLMKQFAERDNIKSKDLKSRLPLKKRLEKPIKQEDEVIPKQEKTEEKNEAEENEQQEENAEPKMETPLMYSYETLKNIEIVTIDEEERQKEYEKTLKAREHMRHVCVHCAIGFVLKQAFDMHMKVHSPESGDHECLLCHCRLKTADMLYKHRLRHYRRYRCLLCRMRFKDKDTAACHVMNDHTGQTFECDRCGRGFKRPQYLKKHVAQHHTKPHDLVCGVCFRVFHERGWYRSHIRTHNEEVRAKTVRLPVTCEICSRDYKNKASLKRHLLTHDEDVHCEICFEKCKNRITLGNHYLKVHNEKYVGAPEQTCPHCDRICATRAMLKRHIQRMHSDRTKKYQCDYCQRFYLTKGEVRSHITWSHMPAEARGGHACTCGRIFRSPSLLRDHKARFHAAEPPPRVHQCDHCDKAFANKQVLNRHKKSHSNEMYPCNECGLLFKTQPYVKVHYQLKHLNMTRAQIKAQRKLNREQIIQNNINKSTNWEPHIADKKTSAVAVEIEEDPLLVQEGEVPLKTEQENEFKIPTFQTFVDISRD